MPATTVLPKRKQKKVKTPNRHLATEMLKKGIFTSQWTEQDAKQFFTMNKNQRSVLRTGKDDPGPAVEWTNFNNEVKKNTLDAEPDGC